MDEIDSWISQLQHSGSADARADAAEELGEFGGGPAIAALISALTDPADAVKVSAALALGELRVPEATGTLQEFLAAPDPNLRGAAAVALGQIGLPGTAARLLPLTRDPVAAVRGGCAWALGTLGDSSAYEVLARLAGDSDTDVADAAQEAVRRLRKSGAVL